jgi:hypothetical protein
VRKSTPHKKKFESYHNKTTGYRVFVKSHLFGFQILTWGVILPLRQVCFFKISLKFKIMTCMTYLKKKNDHFINFATQKKKINGFTILKTVALSVDLKKFYQGCRIGCSDFDFFLRK